MAIHFTVQEFQQRQSNAVQQLQARNLDGLLMFRQESMYYLSGYDTFGYAMFQCMYIGADGRLVLLTRAPDRAQAELTSILDDVRIWKDEAGMQPAHNLRVMLADLGLANTNLGIEFDAFGLTAHLWRQVETELDGFCQLTDASNLINELRYIKSPQELDYIQRAAELSDDALDAGLAITKAGAFEGDILAAMQGAVFSGGGCYAGNEFIIGSGEHALLCRYHAGPRHLDKQDQMTLEWAGCYKRYHAAMMRTVIIGEPEPAHHRMHQVATDALQACEQALVPGNTLGQVFDAHAQVVDEGGFGHARLNACGYTMGSAYAPIWVDHPMIYAGNPMIVEENMVFFLHMILVDRDSRLAMCPGHSVQIKADGAHRLNRSSLDMLVY